MQSQLFLAIALALVCGAASQTIVIGGCDRATPMQQFNLTAVSLVFVIFLTLVLDRRKV